MKKIISGVLALVLTATFAFAKDYSSYPQKFWDLPNTHWAYTAVSELCDKNVINGFEDGSFRPGSAVTRAEWAKMMVTALGLSAQMPELNDIYDVSAGDWFYLYVYGAKPYMNFYTIGNQKYFKPLQTASREDVTVSLVKMKGYDVENVDYSYLNNFSDLDSISNNLKRYVAVAVQKKLVDGFDDGTFKGQDTLTRAEAAMLLYRAFQTGSDNKITLTPSPTPVQITATPTKAPTPRPTATPKPTPQGINIINITPTPTVEPEPTPTIAPISTPTAEPEPTPTIAPTEAPTPAPTAVPTPKPTTVPKKAKCIETLCRADVKSRAYQAYWIQQGDNAVYYIDTNNNICKVDTLSGKSARLINIDDIKVKIDGKKYGVSNFKSMYYDRKAKKLMGVADMKNSEYVQADVIQAVTFSLPDCAYVGRAAIYIDNGFYIVGALKSGKIITDRKKLYTPPTYDDRNDVWDVDDVYLTFDEHNGNIYFCTNRTLKKYNYVDTVTIMDMPKHQAHNVTESGVYIMNSSCITKTDFDGKIVNTLKYSDINVNDYSPFNIGNVTPVLLSSEKENIVFYDFANKSFRIIYTGF